MSHVSSEKVFVSQKWVSGFPEKRLTSGEVRGTSGEVRETSGEVWETSGEPLDCYSVPQWENFRGSRRKLPGKFGKLPGKSGDFQGSSGEPDSLPVTRQICLQLVVACMSFQGNSVWIWGLTPAASLIFGL